MLARRPFHPQKFFEFLHQTGLVRKVDSSSKRLLLVSQAGRNLSADNGIQAGGIARYGICRECSGKPYRKSRWRASMRNTANYKEHWQEPFLEWYASGAGVYSARFNIPRLCCPSWNDCLLSDSGCYWLASNYGQSLPDSISGIGMRA